MLVHRGLKYCGTLRYWGMFIILLLTGFLVSSFFLSCRSSTTFDFILDLNIMGSNICPSQWSFKSICPCLHSLVIISLWLF